MADAHLPWFSWLKRNCIEYPFQNQILCYAFDTVCQFLDRENWLASTLFKSKKRKKKNTTFISVSPSLYWITWCRHPQFTSDCLSFFFVCIFVFSLFLLELSRVDWNIDRASFIQCLLSATHRFFGVTSGLFCSGRDPILSIVSLLQL